MKDIDLSPHSNLLPKPINDNDELIFLKDNSDYSQKFQSSEYDSQNNNES